ncbi:hypothetical protein GCM10011529_05840 [Polymorphobacter glacialis]|uniref:Negative regulator of flagellin synthesis n=1 Tax=Sandarakinorhabdus glacialis TaxID=1614636 RepID=A0A916ZKH1_9SPHN|nr:hypothetical protein GCM10011529_05840 [Polymorphobacter glacialis]
MMNEENDVIDSVGRSGLPRPIAAAGGAGSRRVEAELAPVAVAGGAGTRGVGTPVGQAAGQAVGQALGRIVKDLAASPPVDMARVDALRNAIATGAYKPDPDAIAGKMMALETLPRKA